MSLTQDGKEFAQADLASSLASVGKFHEEFVAPAMDAESLESNRETPGLQEVEPGVFRGVAVVGSAFTDTYSWPDSDLILVVCNVRISAVSGPETTSFMNRPRVVALFDPKSQSFSAIRLVTPDEHSRGFNMSKTLPFPADTGI